MAYKHKRSSVAGNIPATGILKVGEIAVNFADKSIYTEDAGGNVIELARDIPRLANAPATATEGDTYFDTTTNELKYYNGTIWVTPSTGTVTSVATGTGLTGGPISTTGTIALADTVVTPGSQGSANSVSTFTVDQQGRLTAAGNTSIAIDWTQVTTGKPTTLSGYGITDGVKTVNGVVPDAAGNVAVALGNVSTGLSGAYPAGAVEGDIFIVSGDTTENNGKAYIYDGSSWVEISGPDMAAYDARYVNVTGDTMTGTLTLSGAPTADNEAATKKYVDDLVANNEVVISTLAFNGSNVTITENKGNTFTVDIASGLDSRYVNVTGDTMTGTLGIIGLSANGAVGTAGQVLTSDGANTYWSTPSYFDANAQITFANTITFSSTVSVNALSANGTLGTAGQVLISTGTDTYWGTDNVAVFEVIAGAGLSGGTITGTGTLSVNTDHSFSWTNTHSFSNTVTLKAVSANGSIGAAGEILKSDGTKTYWGTAGGTGTVTSVATGAGLSGGPISTTGTIALADTAVTTGSYGNTTNITTFTVDQQGRLTAAGTSKLDWAVITTGKPTTLAGYGITDGVETTRSITGATSLTGGGDLSANRTIALVGDSAAPGNSFYYGTNGTGTKGFFSLPAGGTGTVTSITGGTGLTGGTITGSGTLAIDTTAALTFSNNMTFSNNVIVSKLSANGSIGTAGQVLKSDGSKIYWDTAAATGTVTSVATGTGLSGGPITATGTIALADTAVTTGSYGNTTNIVTFTVDQQGRLTAAGTSKLDWSVITTGKPTTVAGYGITDAITAATQVTFSNTITFSNTVFVNAMSANGSLGTAGQVLTTTGTDTYWSSAATGTVTSVIAGAGLTGGTITTSNTITVDVAAQFAWTNTHTFSNTVFVNAMSANGSLGTAGQVLTSTGTDSYWATMSGSKWTDTGANIYRNSNVAIGSTTAPTTALFVTGDATVTANLVVDTSTLVVDATNNRVGIGNTAPTVELEVTGQAKISANVAIDTNTLFVDAVTNRVGFGNTTPVSQVDVNGTAAHNVVVVAASAMDLAVGQVFTKTAAGSLNWTFTNVPAGRAMTVVLHLTDGASGTQAWPASVKWPGGLPPTLSNPGVDVLVFNTHDGGTTWRGNIFGKDIK